MTLQTTADSNQAENLDRNAYNAAFYELGLGWHWDARTYDSLRPLNCKAERVRTYLTSNQPHLLKAYDPAFLADAIETTKTRCIETMLECGGAIAGQADWAALHGRQIGI